MATIFLSKKKKYFFSIILILSLFFISEFVCYFISTFYLESSLLKHGHPLFNKQHPWRTLSYTQKDAFEFDPFLGYRFNPSQEFVNLAINQDGFIKTYGDESINLFSKPKGAYRIFLLGGSTVAGSGASSNNTTIASYLKKHLVNLFEGKNIEVINAGVSGYNTHQERNYLLSDIVHYQPDLVIFYDGWNDFAGPTWQGGYRDAFQSTHARYNCHQCALENMHFFNSNSKDSLFYFNFSSFLDASFTGIFIKKTCKRLVNKKHSYLKKLPKTHRKKFISADEAAKLYISNIKASSALDKHFDFKILYFFQPCFIHKKHLTIEEKSILANPKFLFLERSSINELKEFYTICQTFIRNSNISNLFDFSNTLWTNVDETIYIDQCHTNDRGNELIALAMLPYITKLVAY